ncbi:MAG: SIMPL domain-containing protein [Desulfobacterales bacterium]
MLKFMGWTAACWGLVLGLPLVVSAQGDLPAGRITVTGEARIDMVPDRVMLSLGIENQATELTAARELNAQHSGVVLAMIREFGIPDHQVQTTHLRIEPRSDPRQQELQGYGVQRIMAVALEDLTRFEEFLAAILEAGVVRVQGLIFDHSQMEAQQAEARLVALRNARGKAEALAAEFDQILGTAVEIVEGLRPTSRAGDPFNSGAAVLSSESRETLAPGLISVKAAVTVTFQLLEME